jgi:hypothetical protein
MLNSRMEMSYPSRTKSIPKGLANDNALYASYFRIAIPGLLADRNLFTWTKSRLSGQVTLSFNCC